MGCGASSQPMPDAAPPNCTQSTTEPEMEKDSEDAFATGYEALLFPEGKFPQSVRRFTIAVNYELLEGWVKQPSPCCAAAATAGALNALRHLKRTEEGSLSHLDVLQVMARNKASRADKQQASAERCLGASINPVNEQVQRKLAAAGLTLDHKSCTRTYLLDLVREVTAKQCLADQAPECFKLLQQLITQDKVTEEAADEEEEEEENGVEPPAAMEDEQNENVVPSSKDEVMAFDFCSDSKKSKKGRKKRASSVSADWDWQKAVWDWFKSKAGVAKLLRDKPSTGPIGSGDILTAVKEIDRDDNRHHLTGHTLMSKKGQNGMHKLGKDDSEATIAAQWEQLRADFNSEGSVLLFHLTNHYALIYAMREWIQPNGFVVRQILTARRGQRPTVWMDWTEARQIVTKWAGYNILLIRCTTQSQVLDDPLIVEAC